MYSRLEQIADNLRLFSTRTNSNVTKTMVDDTLTSFLRSCQKGSTFRIGRVQELYNQIIPVLSKISLKQAGLYPLASTISKQLVALEVIPEAWKQTQFWHVANFPTETCTGCHDNLCLQCGESAHMGKSCLENLKLKLKTHDSDDDQMVSTLQWKLNHTYSTRLNKYI